MKKIKSARKGATVMSLNSSREPTTKKQLESQFLQRSLSNDGGSSTVTRKPEMITKAEEMAILLNTETT